MKDSMRYSVGYMVVLGVVCAVLLTGASYALRPIQQRNVEAFRKERILRVLDVPLPEEPGPETVLETFETNIHPVDLDGIKTYEYRRRGQVRAIAVPFEGMGVWARITGYLAFEPDGRTLRGLAVTDHEETPGLGGEIESDTFRGQFAGKRLIIEEGRPPIELVQPGTPKGPGDIEGITGATMTGEKIETMLNQAIRTYLAAREGRP